MDQPCARTTGRIITAAAAAAGTLRDYYTNNRLWRLLHAVAEVMEWDLQVVLLPCVRAQHRYGLHRRRRLHRRRPCRGRS